MTSMTGGDVVMKGRLGSIMAFVTAPVALYLVAVWIADWYGGGGRVPSLIRYCFLAFSLAVIGLLTTRFLEAFDSENKKRIKDKDTH